MLIQNKYDLCLIGNLIVDDIYTIDNWAEEGTSNNFTHHKKSFGGIGNLINSIPTETIKLFVEGQIGNDIEGNIIKNILKEKSIDNKLHISHLPTSQAVILSGIRSAEKTSFVNWGCALNKFNPLNNKSRWTHYSYLDTLNVSNLSNNSDIVSADLCLSNPTKSQVKSILNKILGLKYLFISESEIKVLLNNKYDIKSMQSFAAKYKIGYIIYHTRYGTMIVSKDDFFEYKITNLITIKTNVLGAGDAYCANFIYYQLNNIIDNIKAVEYAHKQSTNFIASNG